LLVCLFLSLSLAQSRLNHSVFISFSQKLLVFSRTEEISNQLESSNMSQAPGEGKGQQQPRGIPIDQLGIEQLSGLQQQIDKASSTVHCVFAFHPSLYFVFFR
jgi:hypothetical protein